MTTTPTTIDLLSSDSAQLILKELGIHKSKPEKQALFLEEVGEVIMKSVTLEILKKIPEDEVGRFDELMQNGDEVAWKAFLGEFVKDPDAFIQNAVRKEVSEIKRELTL